MELVHIAVDRRDVDPSGSTRLISVPVEYAIRVPFRRTDGHDPDTAPTELTVPVAVTHESFPLLEKAMRSVKLSPCVDQLG